MDYFCEQCASKPGWAFDSSKAFRHSCQRCFQHRPCNDYSYRKPVQNVSPAPKGKDLVAKDLPPHIDIALPKAKGTGAPAPAVAPQEFVQDLSISVVYDEAPAPVPQGVELPDTRSDADKQLDAVQPNRPGIKLESKPKRK